MTLTPAQNLTLRILVRGMSLGTLGLLFSHGASGDALCGDGLYAVYAGGGCAGSVCNINGQTFHGQYYFSAYMCCDEQGDCGGEMTLPSDGSCCGKA